MIKKMVSLTTTILIVIFLLITLIFYASNRLSAGTPKWFGYEVFVVLSGSMEPHIHTGSVIAIKQGVDPAQLDTGDVVTYRSADNPNLLITHRIKEIRQSGSTLQFITQGDANNAPDTEPVQANHIVGRYANITIPYLGYFFHFEQSKAGIFTLLIVPGVLLVLWQLVSLFRAIFRIEESSRTSPELQVEDRTTPV